MHVFLDDAGDSGFKIGQGSSTHLVMAAVIFNNTADIRDAATRITMFKQEKFRNTTRELKFSKTSDRLRREFYEHIQPVNFGIRAISINKANLTSEHLRENPSKLKPYAIMQLLTHHFGTIQNAKLVIDGQDTKGFGMSDRQYLMRRINEEVPGTLRAIEFADSRQNQMVQLADMAASGILRCVRNDDKRNPEFVRALSAKMCRPRGTLWHFK